MLNIKVDFTDSYYNKTNTKNIEDAIKDLIEYASEQFIEECKAEAPVRTGQLRDGHYSRLENLTAHIYNEMEYAPYVIYGTSKQSPNNYPQRVANRMSGTNRYQSLFHQSLITKGMIP